MDKQELISAIVGSLESDLAVLVSAAKTAKDEATDQENRQEGMYDMRAQTAAYVAEGQANLAAELGEAIAAYRHLASVLSLSDVVAVGSLVTLENGAGRTAYFIGPARGGIEVEAGGVPVTVITVSSPLGRLLVGRRAGDSVRSGAQTQRVAAIE